MGHRYAVFLRLTTILAVGLFVLSGCKKAPAESSDASSAPAVSTAAPVTAPTADPRYTGSRDSDGVQVNWGALPTFPAPADTKTQNLCTYSPHYKLTFTPRDDYGTLHTYSGAVRVMSDVYEVYGLLDGQLRLLTPTLYDSIEDCGSIWFLCGSSWRAEENPQVKKIFAYNEEFTYIYFHLQVVTRDGSRMLDDNYCFSERIKDGYMLFSVDGSLTLIDNEGNVTARLPGGDYCWVQPIEKGRLFAFHGLDGAVTVRDRTGKTVSRFTKAQMGDDVRFTYPGGFYPETELVWQGGIGYVQHHDDSGYGRDWVTRYLYADTGEVKKPPVKGLARSSHVEQERVETPYVSREVSVPEEKVPEAVKSRVSYFAVRDAETEEIYYYATDSTPNAAGLYEDSPEWTLYDGVGRCIVSDLQSTHGELDKGYLKDVQFVYKEETKGSRISSPEDAYVTRYIRLSDGKTVFYYRDAPDEKKWNNDY